MKGIRMEGTMEEAWDHLWSCLDKAAAACLDMQRLHREFLEKMDEEQLLKGEIAAQWEQLWETIKGASFEAISSQAALREFERCLQEEVEKKMAKDEEEAPAPTSDEMAEALLYAREFALWGTLVRIRAATSAAGGLDLHDRALAATALLDKTINGLEAKHILKFWGRRVKI